MKIIPILILLTTLSSRLLAAEPAGSASASPSLAKDSRCFELRTYYAAPGKFEALHARFRDHTNKLFVKHGMELVGYWVPIEGQWMAVPDRAIIRDRGNPVGQAVVWYVHHRGAIIISCFVPADAV